MKASVRFNSGGSGPFVSVDGLVSTSHHVGSDDLQTLSSAEHNYLRDGFHVASPEAAAPEPVERFQSERRVQRLCGGFQGDARQQTGQQSRQDRSGYAVSWQHLGQEDGDGAPAPAALASIGAKGPLTAGPLPVGVLGIVAHQAAVAIQRAATAAVRAALPLERKSAVCNAGSSRTKRMRGGGGRHPGFMPEDW